MKFDTIKDYVQPSNYLR